MAEDFLRTDHGAEKADNQYPLHENFAVVFPQPGNRLSDMRPARQHPTDPLDRAIALPGCTYDHHGNSIDRPKGAGLSVRLALRSIMQS
ncbi:MAG: hypothetical protein ACM3W7_03920, partial [Acidobacteriota bacterium]